MRASVSMIAALALCVTACAPFAARLDDPPETFARHIAEVHVSGTGSA